MGPIEDNNMLNMDKETWLDGWDHLMKLKHWLEYIERYHTPDGLTTEDHYDLKHHIEKAVFIMKRVQC